MLLLSIVRQAVFTLEVAADHRTGSGICRYHSVARRPKEGHRPAGPEQGHIP
jgi:hypothetical protein